MSNDNAVSHVLTDVQDRVMTIRLNRPGKKNALTLAMYEAITEAIARAEGDKGVRAVLITGTPDCFSSGNDIMDFLQNPPQGNDTPVARFMATMAGMQKPLVASVNGLAIGVGVTLLLHCDLVYAGENARLQMPFVNIGITPEFGSSLLLPLMMGHQRAAELILLGEPFSAATAREYGLVNAVCPDAETETRARAVALKLAQQPPNALRTSKRLLKRNAAAVAEAMQAEADHFIPMLRGAEALEAMSAFVQKRKADFSKFS